MRRRGGSRAVDGKRVIGPWEDMKRNKKITVRRRRQMERAAFPCGCIRVAQVCDHAR